MMSMNSRMRRWLLPAVLSLGLSLPVLAQGTQVGSAINQQDKSASIILAQVSHQGGILRKSDQSSRGQEQSTVGLYDSPALANLDNDLNDPNDTDNASYGVLFWIGVCAIVAAMLGLILYGMIRTKRSESHA